MPSAAKRSAQGQPYAAATVSDLPARGRESQGTGPRRLRCQGTASSGLRRHPRKLKKEESTWASSSRADSAMQQVATARKTRATAGAAQRGKSAGALARACAAAQAAGRASRGAGGS